jgi:hypothetical protein
MNSYLCHDFKSPRTDTSRRLPNSMRLVPIMFYVVICAASGFGVKDFLAARKAGEREAEAIARATTLKAEVESINLEKANIEAQRRKGENIAQWIEGTRIVQPVAVAIARALPLETDITSLVLERNSDLPAQVNLTIQLLNGGIPEFAKIESSISRLNYRLFSPQQDKEGEGVEFRSLLVYQGE